MNVVHVPCPKDNAVEMVLAYAGTLRVFDDCCPASARVIEVAGIRETGRLKCAWMVKYVRRQGFEHVDTEVLAWQIRVRHPSNTFIWKEIKQYPPGLILIYSVYCLCLISPLAGINSDKLLITKMKSEGDIKLEEDEQ